MKNLNELKAEHTTLTFTDKTKSEMCLIDFKHLQAIFTDKLDTEEMTESDACIVYVNRNKLLKLKADLLNDLQEAVRAGDENLIKQLDYFNEKDDKREFCTNV